MTKKKATKDPFGLSLLDALTNALGGVILLMFIVAAMIKGKDYRKLNLGPEDEQGLIYTVREFKRTDVKLPAPRIMLVQLEFFSDVAIIPSLSVVTGNGRLTHCSLAKAGTTDNEWVIVRNGISSDDWQVTIPSAQLDAIESVGIYITHNQQAFCAEIGKNIINTTILEVKEGKTPQVKVFGGRDCKI